MSRNSKNARNLARAKQIRQNGGGPAKTTPVHGKRWTYRNNPEVQKRLAEAVKAVASARTTKTSGAEILESAGGASK